MKNPHSSMIVSIFGWGLLLYALYQLIWIFLYYPLNSNPIIYFGPGVFLACGILLLVLSMIVKQSMKRMGAATLSSEQIQVLKQNGHKIVGKIIHLEQVTSFRHNMRSPYILHVQAKDPFTGQDQVYKSEWIWEDPFIAVQNQKEVMVYIDKMNASVYFVDTSFITPKN